MFELENLPDLLKPCGMVYPRQEDQYTQMMMQDILVTKSDLLPQTQEVRPLVTGDQREGIQSVDFYREVLTRRRTVNLLQTIQLFLLRSVCTRV